MDLRSAMLVKSTVMEIETKYVGSDNRFTILFGTNIVNMFNLATVGNVFYMKVRDGICTMSKREIPEFDTKFTVSKVSAHGHYYRTSSKEAAKFLPAGLNIPASRVIVVDDDTFSFGV